MMKLNLKFSRKDNENTVEIVKENDEPEAFTYPNFIQYLLDGEAFEDVEFEPVDQFEDYEQTAIKSMITKIKTAVKNPNEEESKQCTESES